MWTALVLIALQQEAGDEGEAIGQGPLRESTILENFVVERDLEWSVDFSGTLHVWVTADEFEPTLLVLNDSRRHRSKRGGGGAVPYLCIPAVQGEVWRVRVDSEDPNVVCTVHIVEAPDELGDEDLVARGDAVIESLDKARGVGPPTDALTELSKIADEITPPTRESATWKRADLAMRLTSVAERSGAAVDAVRLGEFAVGAAAHFLPVSHPRLVASTQQLAAALVRVGELERAHELFVRVLELRIATLQKDDLQVQFARQNVAAILTELGRYSEALSISSEVLAAFETKLPVHHPNHLAARINHAVMMGKVGDRMGAVALQEELLEAIEPLVPKTDDNLDVLRRNLADDLLALGSADRAFAILSEIDALHQSTGSSRGPEAIDLGAAIGRTLIAKGELVRARAHFEELERLCNAQLPPGSPLALEVMACLGGIQFEMGDYGGAAATFESVLDAKQTTLGSEHPDVLATHLNLAQAVAARGDLENARIIEEAVCRSYEANHPYDVDGLLAARLNLAATRAQLGDVDGAIVTMEQALDSADGRLSPSHPVLLRLQYNLAGQLAKVRQSDRALELTEHVLRERERSLPPDHLETATSRMAYAGLLSTAGKFDEASRYLADAYATYERAGLADSPDARRCQANVGLNLYRSGRFDEARETLLRAEQQRQEGGNEVDIDRLEIVLALAAIEHAEQAWSELAPRLTHLLDLQRRSVSRLVSEPMRVARSMARAEVARLGNVMQMVQAMPSDARNELMTSVFWTLEEIRAVAVEQPRVVRELRMDASTRALFDQLADAGTAIASATRLRPTDGASASARAWQARLIALTDRRDALERELRAHGVLGGAEEIASLRHANGSLAADEAIVTAIRHRRSTGEPGGPESGLVRNDFLSCFVLSADGTVRCIEIGSISTIEERVEAWRSSIGAAIEPRGLGGRGGTGSSSDVQHDAGIALRQLVLDPVCLAAPNATKLTFVLDDILHLVPFDALPRGDGLVGDTTRIEVVASLGSLVASEPTSHSGKLVAFGGIDYDATDSRDAAAESRGAESDESAADFTALAGALEELEEVARTSAEFDGPTVRKLQGAEATKERLASEAPTAEFLHIATHGWFDASAATGDAWSADVSRVSLLGELAPETLCGLALSGANRGNEGILTAEELATLDLSNCELAVLSACETNVGIRRAGQGIQSLQTALHAAGARTAITSLWKVDDAATRRLFELFYTKLWSEQLGPADALWQAKMALRSEGHPTRDWAGWVLTGDPD